MVGRTAGAGVKASTGVGWHGVLAGDWPFSPLWRVGYGQRVDGLGGRRRRASPPQARNDQDGGEDEPRCDHRTGPRVSGWQRDTNPLRGCVDATRRCELSRAGGEGSMAAAVQVAVGSGRVGAVAGVSAEITSAVRSICSWSQVITGTPRCAARAT